MGRFRTPPRQQQQHVVAEPRESDIVALMDMGFPREAVLGALRYRFNFTLTVALIFYLKLKECQQ